MGPLPKGVWPGLIPEQCQRKFIEIPRLRTDINQDVTKKKTITKGDQI